MADQIAEGERAGRAAAREAGVPVPEDGPPLPANGRHAHRAIAPLTGAQAGGGKAILCTCEDITADD